MNNTVICKICGKKQNLKLYAESFSKKLSDKKLCFDCMFWEEVAKDETTIIINGIAYRLGEEVAPMKGYGGRKFIFRMNNGKIITSTNVWCQGQIPRTHRERLPDNATLVKEKEI